jgi:tRNA wybutosine-synthesizing protein 4
LESKYANQIISYAASLPKSYFVTYEQHNPDDAFGKMMLQNLMHRGIKLCGLEDYPQLSLKTDQYSNAGFKSIMAKNLHEISQQLITDTEMERLNGIERLDEVEEWKLLMEHYFILIASCSEEDLGSSVMWKNS